MKSRQRLSLAGVGVLALTVAATLGISRVWPTERVQAGGGSRTAQLHVIDGSLVGTARFTPQGEKVLVQVEVRGLPAGFHGLHVHAVGMCDPSTAFMSAGGHFNPADREHADHAGDGPSLYVNADGTGMLMYWTDRYTLSDLSDADANALIVHALPDNFANIPTRYAPAPDAMTLATGDAGGRLACGVIE